MKKEIFILFLAIAFSRFCYSQTDKIIDSDFAHYTDCQRLVNCKTANGDTLKIKKSFLFDIKGNVIRKLEEVLENPPMSKELTIYEYDNKHLHRQILYKRTDMDNIFETDSIIYFYNINGLIDSQVVITTFPNFAYKYLEEIPDSTLKEQNIREFNEPILTPFLEDTTSTSYKVMTVNVDGKKMMVNGWQKVKKEVQLLNMISYKSTTCRYNYNTKKQRIKEFYGREDMNRSSRRIIDYDTNNRLVSVLCYAKNSYKFKFEAEMDSTSLLRRAVYNDNLNLEDAIKQVEKKIKEEKSDTILIFNTSIIYNKDGSITELAVYSNKTCKLIIFRNKKGQMVKTISTYTYVQNKYENGKFIPTDTKKLPLTEFSYFKTTTIYKYDSIGRIIKSIEKNLDNHDSEKKEYRKSENFTVYKYNSDLPIFLPESEYVDGYYKEHFYYSIRK